jgi:hypothetical protein
MTEVIRETTLTPNVKAKGILMTLAIIVLPALLSLATILGVVVSFVSLEDLPAADSELQTTDLQRELRELKSKLDAMAASPRGSGSEQQIAFLRGQITSFNRRLDKMEAAIVGNPVKANPLLLQDVDASRKILLHKLYKVRAEIARLYELSRWFLGLMIALAVGVLALAVGNIAKKDNAWTRTVKKGGRAKARTAAGTNN